MKRLAYLLFVTFCLAGCEKLYWEDHIYGDESDVAVVYPRLETTPVDSSDDAADDPALWYNAADPAASLILGTDKQSGVGIYDLSGNLVQFIPAGLPNNIDLRQGVTVGAWQGDLAAASNRDGDVATLFSINRDGGEIIGSFPAGLPEPYGSCMGILSGQTVVFITYKTGEVQAHQLQAIGNGNVEQVLLGTIYLETQLEGCIFDDDTGMFYVGEEARGLWSTRLTLNSNSLEFTEPVLVDEVDGASGITADVEGVSMYIDGDDGYLVVSSQGNNSYAVYERAVPHRFMGRFRVMMDASSGVDGSQETDGLHVAYQSLGPDFPDGLIIFQDGFNAPVGEAQNFKVVDWRDVKEALDLH